MAQAILHVYQGAKLTIGPVVEDGFYYDIDMGPVSEDDFPRIEAEIQRIIQARIPFRRREVSKAEALAVYKDEPYKLEMIQDLTDGTISPVRAGGFYGPMQGPHLPHTGFVKAIKLMKVSGAYWRAINPRPSFSGLWDSVFDKKELKAHIQFIEEAKKRNHRKIGAALDLFSFHDEAPGMPFFHARGMVIWNALLNTGGRSTGRPAMWRPKRRSC